MLTTLEVFRKSVIHNRKAVVSGAGVKWSLFVGKGVHATLLAFWNFHEVMMKEEWE